MADNRRGYGFRYHKNRWGSQNPIPMWLPVASGAAFNVTGGAQAVGLGAGDPVVKVSDGSVQLANGSETTVQIPWGIVMDVGYYWNGQYMVHDETIPSGTTYGTVFDRQTFVNVLPIEAAYWEVDCLAAVSVQTIAGVQDLVGNNVNHKLTGAVGDPRAYPMLDIANAATTNSFAFRIEQFSLTKDNVDLTGKYLKFIVSINVGATTGVAGLTTTTTGI